MRLLGAFIVWFAALNVIGICAATVVWGFAGPHSGLLPGWLEIPVWLLGYAMVLIVPIALAVFVFRNLSRIP